MESKYPCPPTSLLFDVFFLSHLDLFSPLPAILNRLSNFGEPSYVFSVHVLCFFSRISCLMLAAYNAQRGVLGMAFLNICQTSFSEYPNGLKGPWVG